MASSAFFESGAKITLFQVQKLHRDLMHQSMDRKAMPELVGDISKFIEKVAELGAILEAHDERADAQNILDYWNASLFTINKSGPLKDLPTELKPFSIELSQIPLSGDNRFCDAHESDLLLGREDAIRDVIDILREHPITFITGPVGSGRSSLVRAGVVPRLLNSASEPREVFSLSSLGADPLHALGGIVGNVSAAVDLRRSPDLLRVKVDEACGDRGALIVVDNVDELFTRCSDQQTRETAAEAIASLAAEPRRHSVILILRDDWAEFVCELSALKPYYTAGARYTSPPPTASEIQLVLNGLVSKAGLRIDTRCVKDLARELQGDPGALSLAKFMLQRLWPLRKGSFISWDAYKQLGRPNEAMAKVAEDVYDNLTDEGKFAAKRLFLALVKPGLGPSAACQRESRKALDADGSAAMTEALDAFASAGLLRESAPGDNSDDSLEIIHASLTYRWRRLAQWLEELKRDSERRLRVLSTVGVWEKSGRDPRYLFGDEASIRDVRQYIDSTPESKVLREFVEESSKALEEARRRKSLLIFGSISTACVLLICYILTVLYYQKNQKLLINKYVNKLHELASEEQSSPAVEIGKYLEFSTDDYLDKEDIPEREETAWSRIDRLRKYGDAAADLSGVSIHNLDLTGIDLSDARLVSAEIIGVNLASKQNRRRDLANIAFDDSKISTTRFDGSDLSFSQFRNSKLTAVSFIDSNLYRAAFDKAQLCDVAFEGAYLSRATFWNATINEPTTVSLANTAWWLAAGWSTDQIHHLLKQKPVELSQSPAFVQDRQRAQNRVDSAPLGDFARAIALNDLAWTLAISNVDLIAKSEPKSNSSKDCGVDPEIPSTAQDAAVVGLCIIGRLVERSPNLKKYLDSRAALEDTLGYIFLQSGQIEKALDLLKKAAETNDPETLFRLSVAENASGKYEDAVRDMRTSLAKGYIPTHERALLATYLENNDFGLELDKELGVLYPSHRSPIQCPS